MTRRLRVSRGAFVETRRIGFNQAGGPRALDMQFVRGARFPLRGARRPIGFAQSLPFFRQAERNLLKRAGRAVTVGKEHHFGMLRQMQGLLRREPGREDHSFFITDLFARDIGHKLSASFRKPLGTRKDLIQSLFHSAQLFADFMIVFGFVKSQIQRPNATGALAQKVTPHVPLHFLAGFLVKRGKKILA